MLYVICCRRTVFFKLKVQPSENAIKSTLVMKTLFLDANVMLGKDCFSHASILFLYLSIFLSSDGNHYQSPTKLHHILT